MRRIQREDSLPQIWLKLNNFFREIEPVKEVYIPETIEAKEAAIANNEQQIPPVSLEELCPDIPYQELRNPTKIKPFERYGFQFSHKGEPYWFCRKLDNYTDFAD